MGERFEQAKKKYSDKMEGRIPTTLPGGLEVDIDIAWQRGVAGKKKDYKKGVADFLGIEADEIGEVAENYEKENARDESRQNYYRGVQKKSDKWGKNYTEKMTRH